MRVGSAVLAVEIDAKMTREAGTVEAKGEIVVVERGVAVVAWEVVDAEVVAEDVELHLSLLSLASATEYSGGANLLGPYFSEGRSGWGDRVAGTV